MSVIGFKAALVMTYTLRFEEKPEFLHCIVEGRNTVANVAGYLQAILRECQARHSSAILIEERLDGPRLSTIDVFEIAASRGGKPLVPIKAIAYVDVNREGPLMQFAEDVAVNRGVPVTVFGSVAEARDWLLNRHRAKS